MKKMAKVDEVVELLNTLIQSTIEDIVKTNKATLANIKICLQHAQNKIDFLQLESQLQQDELQQKRHHFELFFVQNNPLFEVETNFHQ